MVSRFDKAGNWKFESVSLHRRVYCEPILPLGLKAAQRILAWRSPTSCAPLPRVPGPSPDLTSRAGAAPRPQPCPVAVCLVVPCDAITDFFRSARRRRHALGDGPDEAGQLTGDRGSDDIGRVCPSSVPAWSLASSCAVRHELRAVGENYRDDYAPLSRRLGGTPGLPMPVEMRRLHRGTGAALRPHQRWAGAH